MGVNFPALLRQRMVSKHRSAVMTGYPKLMEIVTSRPGRVCSVSTSRVPRAAGVGTRQAGAGLGFSGHGSLQVRCRSPGAEMGPAYHAMLLVI